MKQAKSAGYGSLDRIVEIVASAVRSRDHLVEQVLDCIEHTPADREQWKTKVEASCNRLYGKRSEEYTLDKNTREALRRVLAYLEKDELSHWEEMGKPKNHIYRDLCAVAGGTGFILNGD